MGQAGVRGGRGRRPALPTHVQTPWRLQAVARRRGRMRGACERVEAGDAGNTWRGGQDTPEVTLGYEEPLTRQLSLRGVGGGPGRKQEAVRQMKGFCLIRC